jgi:Alpha/beta hydrolase domain
MAAPLGTYEGLDYDFKESNVFFLISGVYKPFSKEELAARYTDHDAYVATVSAAANELVAQRYMLEEDAIALIEAAKQSDIGRR